MPTQQEVDQFLSDLRSKRDTVDSLYAEFDIELRVHSTGQVEVIGKRPVMPGEAAGTAGTQNAPDTPTAADYRVRDVDVANLAEEMRSYGADVETFQRGSVGELYATFAP